jgi:DNA-binding LytR/AlgR family response regulator
MFLAAWLELKDQNEAFKVAFGDRSTKRAVQVAASLEMRKPYMKAALARVTATTEHAIATLEERSELAAKLAPQNIHWLENRLNRTIHLAKIASGEHSVTAQYVTETGEVVEYERKPDYKDMLAAAKLLGQMSGDYIERVEVKDTTENRVVFVRVDNGLGPAPEPEAEDMEHCPGCETIVQKNGHECRKALRSGT